MLKRIIFFVLRNFATFAFRKKLILLSELTASLLASLKILKFVVVRWDGEDWLFRWQNSGAVVSCCDYDPINNIADLDLFFFNYTPMPGDLIVNVGVENGSEIPSFCMHVGEKGQVYAIEADPACCRRLYKLKEMLSLKNLTIINAAIGAYDGYARFSQDLGSMSNRLVTNDYNGDTIKVQVNTLHSLMKEQDVNVINYIKINIEGAEVKLLEGLLGTDLYLHNICLSCHDFIGPECRSYDFCKNWLLNAGYEIASYTPYISPCRSYYLYAKNITNEHNLD